MLLPTVSRAVRGLTSGAAKRSLGTAANELPAYLLEAPATEVTELPSGLRVASEGSHGETATISVFIDAGSRCENERNNGVAHFLEHMAFKGTRNRTQHGLEVEIENLGGHLNAYTSREQTVYQAKVFKDDVPKAMGILSDILQNATYDERAIERERDVILREMQEVEKIQEEVIFDRLHETAYQGTGLGRTILGPVENIKTISKADLQQYIEANYSADRVVIAAAGAVNHQQLADLASEHFNGLPAAPAGNVLTTESDPAIFTGSEIRVREDHEHLAHVAVAFESAGWTSPHAFPLMVMQQLLGCWSRTSGSGSNMASKLCQTVAEQECAHSIMTFNTQYKDTGLFGVYSVGLPTKQADSMFYVMESITRLSHQVTEEEVARARNQLKSSMCAHLDGSMAISEDIGRQLLTYGRRLTPAEVFARIDAVDAAAVKKTAGEFCYDQDFALAAIGPVHEVPDYNWIRRETYSILK